VHLFILYTPHSQKAARANSNSRPSRQSAVMSAVRWPHICWPHDAQMMPAVSVFFLSTVLISEIKKKNQNPKLSTLNSQLSILNHAHVVVSPKGKVARIAPYSNTPKSTRHTRRDGARRAVFFLYARADWLLDHS
jgi:hypothetical protein